MIEEAIELLGIEKVLTNGDLLPYQKNLTGLNRDIIAVFKPDSVEEIRKIVLLANQYKTSLYPISTGKNWGMGSKLPVQNNCVLLDLGSLNKIRSVDIKLGVAVIEPGVTQRQLSDHLSSISAPFFLDVTGSGSDTSVIGNTIERGIAYNSERVSQIINLEILTGNGEILKTGFAGSENNLVKDLYRYGIGPAIDGLFFQSNFGIILSATFSLFAIPEYQVSFTVSLTDTKQLLSAVNVFSELLRDKVIDGIPHIFDKNRFLSLATPALYQKLLATHKNIDATETEKVLEKITLGEWFIGGTIMGKKKIVKARIACMRQAMNGIAQPRFMGTGNNFALKTIMRLFQMKHQLALMEATASLKHLNSGRPTDIIIKSIYWPSQKTNCNLENKEPDNSEAGLKILNILCPMRGADVETLLTILQTIKEKYGLFIATSLNGISFRCLEIVITIFFSKSNETETEKAHQCVNAICSQLAQAGFPQFRSGIETMHLIVDEKTTFWQTVKKLKNLFDSNNIISPGRYNSL